MPHGTSAYAEAEAILRARSQQSETGCWFWTGQHDDFGYGRVMFQGRQWRAHRLAYTVWIGPLADGLVVDHLCRVEACIRPDHLEAVTRRENNLRGVTPFANRTRCKSGKHDITDPKNWRRSGTSWQCRLCGNEREAQRRARARAGLKQPLARHYTSRPPSESPSS